MDGYQRVELRGLWRKEIILKLEWFLESIDKEIGDGFDHKIHPYAWSHLKTWDCMYDCIDELYQKYYDNTSGRDICKYNRWDLEWYYLPHGCDQYALLIREYIKLLYPNKIIDILFYIDHFVCIDQQEKQVYDLLYDLSSDQTGYTPVADLHNKKGFTIISSAEIDANPHIDLYQVVLARGII